MANSNRTEIYIEGSKEAIDNFVDGAAVKRVGDKNFAICQKNLHDMITIHEGNACQTILDLYNKEAIIAEPAGQQVRL